MKKKFWFLVLGVAALALLGVFVAYAFWFKFKLGYHLSNSGEVWGQFGDFVGGILNPILSFITIFILVLTSLYQQKQNENSEKREATKRLDDRFYGMLSYQRDSYETSIVSVSATEKIPLKEVVTVFEDAFFNTDNLSFINSVSVKSSVFVIIRQFYLIVKVVDEASSDIPLTDEEKRKYYGWLFNMTDFGLTRLVFFCVFYYKGIAAFDYIRKNKLLMQEADALGLKGYLDNINRRKKELSID